MQARRGELVDVLEGDGLIATVDGEPVALVTWLVDTDRGRAEIRAVAVAAGMRRRGYGRAVMDWAHERLRAAGVARAWLVTTNDNVVARRLYERLGYRLAELRAGAIDEARRTIKPSIPLRNDVGVPIRDELELAKDLALD
jgi:ribosomal protein S18 acetylase RimI-like enzyme